MPYEAPRHEDEPAPRFAIVIVWRGGCLRFSMLEIAREEFDEVMDALESICLVVLCETRDQAEAIMREHAL
jgi:hypothetical protein